MKVRVQSNGLAPWRLDAAQRELDPELDAGVAIHAAARACGISRVHFSRMFKLTTGMSPRRWHLQRRVRHAQVLLETTSASLTDIASQCGFCDQSHFTRVFHRFCATSPGVWRKRRHGGFPSLSHPGTQHVD